jgi:hypothetical protein
MTDEEFEHFRARFRGLRRLGRQPEVRVPAMPAKPQIQELAVEDVFDMGLTGIDKTFLEQFGIRVRENG